MKPKGTSAGLATTISRAATSAKQLRVSLSACLVARSDPGSVPALATPASASASASAFASASACPGPDLEPGCAGCADVWLSAALGLEPSPAFGPAPGAPGPDGSHACWNLNAGRESALSQTKNCVRTPQQRYAFWVSKVLAPGLLAPEPCVQPRVLAHTSLHDQLENEVQVHIPACAGKQRDVTRGGITHKEHIER